MIDLSRLGEVCLLYSKAKPAPPRDDKSFRRGFFFGGATMRDFIPTHFCPVCGKPCVVPSLAAEHCKPKP